MATTAPIILPIKIPGLNQLQKLERRVEALEKEVNRLTRNLPQASNNIRKLGESSRTAARGIEKASNAAQVADTRFGKLGKSALFAFKGFLAFQGLRFLVNSAAEIERVQVQLTTLTGSLDNARIIYEQLDKINKKSPFGTQELVGAAATLRGFGIRLEDLVSTTESLGKISAATGRDIQGIALAYGQVRAKGRLQGEELLQFQERGIPLVAELAKQLGVQEDAIAGMVSKGKIGFKDVQTAVRNLTTENGKFADAFENTADTTFARLSNFQDALRKLAASVFSLFEPVFSWVVENLTTILNLIETAVKRFQRVAQLTPETLQGFRNQAADEANEKFGFFNLSGEKSQFFNDRLNELVDQATGGPIKLDLSFDAPDLPKPPSLGGNGEDPAGAGKAAEQAAKQLTAAQNLLFTEQNRLALAQQMSQLEQINTAGKIKELEIERKFAELLANALTAEETLTLQLAQKAALKANELEVERKIAELREGAISGIEDEIELLRARLNGTEEIYQREKDIQDLIKKGGGTVSRKEAEGKVDERNRLKKQLEQLNKIKAKYDEIATTFANTVANGIKNVLLTAVQGGDIQQAFSDLFTNLGQAFLDIAFNSVAEMLAETIKDAFSNTIDTAQQAAVAAQQTTAAGVMQAAATEQVAAAGTMLVAAKIMAASKIAGKATGGPVIGSAPYIVGERGPELFVPAESGTIIPNDYMASAMQKYTPGSEGSALAGAKGGAEEGGLAVAEAPMAINISGGVMQFGGDDYIRKDQLPEIVAQASKAGEARTMRKLQMSPGARRKLGM